MTKLQIFESNLQQYRTAGDGKVRPEHAGLNGVTLPMDDGFWDHYYPPNGWNCRCTVVQVLRTDNVPTDKEEALRRAKNALSGDKKGMFRFNPGKERRTFPAYNPYTIRKCATCPKAQLKLAAGITDNEFCSVNMKNANDRNEGEKNMRPEEQNYGILLNAHQTSQLIILH